MESAYASHKEWWLEHRAESYRMFYYDHRIHWPDLENVFAGYWCSLNAYERYEILEGWSNNQEIPEGN